MSSSSHQQNENASSQPSSQPSQRSNSPPDSSWETATFVEHDELPPTASTTSRALSVDDIVTSARESLNLAQQQAAEAMEAARSRAAADIATVRAVRDDSRMTYDNDQRRREANAALAEVRNDEEFETARRASLRHVQEVVRKVREARVILQEEQANHQEDASSSCSSSSASSFASSSSSSSSSFECMICYSSFNYAAHRLLPCRLCSPICVECAETLIEHRYPSCPLRHMMTPVTGHEIARG